MDKRGCQRPHNLITQERADKHDYDNKLPVGWDTIAFGPYHYDPDEKQVYPTATQHTTVADPSNHPPEETSQYLPAHQPTNCDELEVMPCQLGEDEGLVKVEPDGDSGSPNSPGDDDIRATVNTMQSQISQLLQAIATIAPSSIAKPELDHLDFPAYGLRPTFKQEPPANEPGPAMHDDAALSHKLFIAGTPPQPEDEFHHEPPSYEDDDSGSDSGSDYDSESDSSDEDDQIDDVAIGAREAYQEETSDSSSAPSSQETAEPVSTPPSSPIRRRRSSVDDEELNEPPSKKVRSSSITLQPEAVRHIKSEDNTQSADQLESEYDSDSATDSGSEHDSETETGSQSDNHPVSEPNVHVETRHYSVREKMNCLRELVKELRKPNGVNLSITGTELTPTNRTGKGTVPPAFHGQSLNTTDHNKVRLAVIDLFKHYSTIMVRTERKVDVVVL